MTDFIHWSNLLAAGIALIPALINVWWGRALTRLPEDAAIAERLLVHRQRKFNLGFFACVVLAGALPHTLIWSIPLLLISSAIASFPSRRALFGETWGLFEYLLFLFRLNVALFGFWILLSACPFLIGSDHWEIGIIIFLVLASWNHWYGRIILRLIGARPLHSDALEIRFAGVVERSKAPPPTIWRAGPAGAVYANAVALPSLKKPSILIFDTLLERLSEEETTAIFAHEVAHLEHYTRTRLSLENFIVLALIAGGTFLMPFFQGAVSFFKEITPVAWPFFVLFCLAIKTVRAQANERASDLRAIELFGNPEALISALTKLHAIGRIPRRWEPEMEVLASHPSLARRIQAIRTAADQPSELQWYEVFKSVETGVFVVFDRNGLQQYRNVPQGCAETVEALQSAAGSFIFKRFGEIAELRVAARGISDPELIIMDCKGERRVLQMHAEDLSRLQHTLDRVDVLLSPAPKKIFARRAIASVTAGVATVSASFAGNLWSVCLIALMASFRPIVRMVATAAIVSVLALILMLTRETLEPEQRWIMLIGILPLVSAALWMGTQSRKEHFAAIEHLPRWFLWLLGGAAGGCICLLLFLAHVSLFSCSNFLKGTVGCAVFPLALALLLVRESKKGLRWLALLFGVAACASIIIGTEWFRERVIRDPLVAAFPEFSISNAAPEDIIRFTVETSSVDIRLSPLGSRIAVKYGDSGYEGPSFYAIYDQNGTRRGEIEAVDLRFVDESQMLILSSVPSGLALDLIEEDKAAALIWRSPSKINMSGRLALKPETGEWRILSYTQEGSLVRFQGILGNDAVNEMEWAPPDPAEHWAFDGTAGSRSESIWIHSNYRVFEFGPIAFLFSFFADEDPVETRLFIGQKAGTSGLLRSEAHVTCLDPPIGEDETICFAYYEGTTSVFALDPADESPKALGTFAGDFWDGAHENPGTVVFLLDGIPTLLFIDRRHLLHISTTAEVFALSASLKARVIGMLATEQDRSEAILIR